MGIINASDLKPGMILASDLVSPQGRMLMPSGSTLDEKHLRIFKIWGVIEADIEGVNRQQTDEASAAEIPPELFGQSDAYLMRYFHGPSMHHEPMHEIFRLCLLQTAQRLADGHAPPEPMGFSLDDEEDLFKDDLFLKDEGSPLDVIRNGVKLASFPDIYFQIKEALDSPRCSATYVADILSKDTSLCALLLKLVNSPFYGFPSQIESISRAVTILGATELSTLVLGISAIQVFEDVPPELIDMKAFWHHAITCGTFAGILAGYIAGLSVERFFVAGLLHDVGRLVMFLKLPGAATQALCNSLAHKVPFYVTEKAAIGFNHTRVGYLLLREWKFPTSLENMVRYHHTPTLAPNPLEASIVHLADIMSHSLATAKGDPAPIPPFQEEAWNSLGLSPSIFEPAFTQAGRQIKEIMDAFFPGAS